MGYSYKKCKTFLENLGYKLCGNNLVFDYVAISGVCYNFEEINLEPIVDTLNNVGYEELTQGQNIIYTLLRNNKEDLLGEE